MGVVVRDAAIAAVLFTVAALAYNALRPEGLPLVAAQEYAIFVPCPEPLGDVAALGPDEALVRDSRTLLVDARSGSEYSARHAPGAVNVVFDFLEPVSEAQARKVASSAAARVVVYGDGGDPDSGRELARELAGKGIRNVFFVLGGAPALLGRASDRSTP